LLIFARLRLAARGLRARIAIAAGIVLFAWWLSGRIRHLVAFVDTNPARLGFEMMGIGIGLAVLTIGIAFALPGPIARRLGLGRSRLPIGAVIALTFGTLGLSFAIDAALSLSAPRALENSVAMGISRGFAGPRGWDFAIALLGSVIAPALGEELLCRGLLQRGLVRWIRPAAAIAISALFFGRLHGELVHGAIATCLGAYLGLAAYWSDSTRPAIAGHAANNFSALLGSAGLAPAVPTVPGLFAGLALAAIGIVWGWRARPRGGDPPSAPPALQLDHSPADA
jgi:membrane protease YdiL (CAAX protease family)